MLIAKDPHRHLHRRSGHFDSEGLSADDGWEPAAAQPEPLPTSSDQSHGDQSHGDQSHGDQSHGDQSHQVSASRSAQRAPRTRARLPRLLRPLLDACVLGGVTMTPVLSILGWVGLLLPIDSAMHQIATALLCVSMIWLGFALVAAHTLRGDARGESRPNGTPPLAR